MKEDKYIIEAYRDSFMLYFDEQTTQVLAQSMIQFIQDGSFIDSRTKEVKVEFLTYNLPDKISSSRSMSLCSGGSRRAVSLGTTASAPSR